mgnify:FL=1
MSKLTLALVQMRVGKDKADNLARAAAFVKEASENGAQLVILPEMFQTPYETSLFPLYAEERGGMSYQALSAMARENAITLVGGSIAELEDGRVYNTSFVFNPEGEEIARHRKVHLFDIDIPGGQYFKESDTLTAGEDMTFFETDFGRIGLGICFDVRFSAFAHKMAKAGARVLVYPAAFNPTTGPKHWELLFRSRANDNQVYTVGVSSLPSEKEGYQAYGHSLVVNPWGEVILEMGTDEGIGYATLESDLIDEVRGAIPLGQ